jgi:hypothetical protein
MFGFFVLEFFNIVIKFSLLVSHVLILFIIVDMLQNVVTHINVCFNILSTQTDFLNVKYKDHKQTQRFSPSACFVMTPLKTTFPTKFTGVFIVYVQTKFHIPKYDK